MFDNFKPINNTFIDTRKMDANASVTAKPSQAPPRPNLLTTDFSKLVAGAVFTVHGMDNQTGKSECVSVTQRMAEDWGIMAKEESAKKRTFVVTLCSRMDNNVMVLTGEEWQQQQQIWGKMSFVARARDCDVEEMRIGDNIYALQFYSCHSLQDENAEEPAAALLPYMVAGVVFSSQIGLSMYAKFEYLRSAVEGPVTKEVKRAGTGEAHHTEPAGSGMSAPEKFVTGEETLAWYKLPVETRGPDPRGKAPSSEHWFCYGKQEWTAPAEKSAGAEKPTAEPAPKTEVTGGPAAGKSKLQPTPTAKPPAGTEKLSSYKQWTDRRKSNGKSYDSWNFTWKTLADIAGVIVDDVPSVPWTRSFHILFGEINKNTFMTEKQYVQALEHSDAVA